MRADVATPPLRAQHERRILDHAQAAAPRERVQRVHVDERAGPVRRHDRFRARRDRRFDLGEVDVARDEVAVDEHRRRADLDDHVEDGEEALRRGDHLVAGTDAGELQRDFDGGGRRGQHAHRPAAAEFRQRSPRTPAPRVRS